MKNWVVVFWLVVFFPVGLYLMFKKTEWPIKNKKIVLGVISFICILYLLSEVNTSYLLLSSLFTIFVGIITLLHSFLRKRNKKTASIILALGIFLFGFTTFQIEEDQNELQAEQQRIVLEQKAKEQEEIKEQKEQKERTEIKAKEEQLEKEKQQEYFEKAELAVENVEQESTRENYDKAFTLVSTLANSDTALSLRLSEVEKIVVLESKKIEAAEAAVKTAEENQTRESFEQALTQFSELKYTNEIISMRLAKVETNIISEEKRVADDQAAKVEEERIASEQAEQIRITTENEQASQEKESQNQRAKVPTVMPSSNSSDLVWIAPQSGGKYHFIQNCRGLNNANSVIQVSLNEAQNQGKTLCGWED